jgi:hypothetical protein
MGGLESAEMLVVWRRRCKCLPVRQGRITATGIMANFLGKLFGHRSIHVRARQDGIAIRPCGSASLRSHQLCRRAVGRIREFGPEPQQVRPPQQGLASSWDKPSPTGMPISRTGRRDRTRGARCEHRTACECTAMNVATQSAAFGTGTICRRQLVNPLAGPRIKYCRSGDAVSTRVRDAAVCLPMSIRDGGFLL